MRTLFGIVFMFPRDDEDVEDNEAEEDMGLAGSDMLLLFENVLEGTATLSRRLMSDLPALRMSLQSFEEEPQPSWRRLTRLDMRVWRSRTRRRTSPSLSLSLSQLR